MTEVPPDILLTLVADVATIKERTSHIPKIEAEVDALTAELNRTKGRSALMTGLIAALMSLLVGSPAGAVIAFLILRK